jgi:probable HAF family extracellular repeat protein
VPKALNDAGTISGQTAAFEPADAFMLTAAGDYSQFDPFGHEFSVATSLNAQGDTVGYSFTSQLSKSWIKPHGKAAIELFEDGHGMVDSYAVAVNSNDVVVGTFERGFGRSLPFSWSNGQVTTLPTLGDNEAWPVAINDAGVIAGMSYVGFARGSHVVKWVDGVISDLGGLGYTAKYGDKAYSINAAGWIAGYCSTALGVPVGCVWHDGAIDRLSTLNTSWSIAFGINDNGIVVGASGVTVNSNHAAIWKNGVIADLNDLTELPEGVVLERANAINNKGEILVAGSHGLMNLDFLLVPAGTP